MDTVKKILRPLNVTTKTVMLIDEYNNLLFSIKSEDSKDQALAAYGKKEVVHTGTREDITTIRIKRH